MNERDITRLRGVHPDICRVLHDVDYPFVVVEGVRTIERQRELMAAGKTKTLNSRHLTGHAVDIAPLVDGRISWEWRHFNELARAVRSSCKRCGVVLEWGGDWKRFPDGPHWQIPWRKE